MAVLVAGLSSFPSSISNSSPEFVDQTNSLNLINTAFADSDDDEDEEDYEDDEDGEKGKPAGVGNGKPEGVGKDKEKKLTENQAKDDDDEYDEEEIEIDVEVEDGVATVEIEIDDEEFEFEFILTATDPDDIREEIENEILARTDLTIEQLSFLEIEFEDEYEDEDYENDIQEFNDATVVHMSNTTTVCHIPPGNPGNAHTIDIGKPAARAHLAHGDTPGECPYNGLGNMLSIKEIKQAEKLTRLAEKQTEKESMALDRANKLIEKLEQRIAQLENRLQTMLNKVESGEYYGTLTQLDTVTQSHSISFDGTATSIYDESVTTGLSGEIFIENLMTGTSTSKFKVTGGEIIVGDNIYDAAFGKVRVSSLGVEGEKDSLVVIIQTFDSDDNDNTIKLTLLFDSAIKADLGTEPISFEIKPNSKISEQWFLSGSGTISLE